MNVVSIIIPVFNEKEYLIKTLKAIGKNTNSNFDIQIIVVDNGSNDGSEVLFKSNKDVVFLSETIHDNSPYSCRNRGIEIAKGNIIILLDATCVPDEKWLKNGLNCLLESDFDIIGGNVLFDFENKIGGAKIYDSLTNIKMKESIEKGIAKTANLFIKREVFEKVGLFPEGIRSGADVRWTYHATKKGIKLGFCERSIVYKPARGFKELIKKQWRVGSHQPMIWKEQNRKVSVFSRIKNIIVPVSPFAIRKLLKNKGASNMQPYYLSVLLTAQIVKLTMAFANIYGLFKLKNE